MRAIIAPVSFSFALVFNVFPPKTRSDSICCTWIEEIDRQIACHLKIDHRWWWRTRACACVRAFTTLARPHQREETKLSCFKQISYSSSMCKRSITNDRVACACYHKFCSFSLCFSSVFCCSLSLSRALSIIVVPPGFLSPCLKSSNTSRWTGGDTHLPVNMFLVL